jgi:hypothetical protein
MAVSASVEGTRAGAAHTGGESFTYLGKHIRKLRPRLRRQDRFKELSRRGGFNKLGRGGRVSLCGQGGGRGKAGVGRTRVLQRASVPGRCEEL